MPRQDRHHFDDYTRQNEAKHRILESYLSAYITILATAAGVRFLHYIDGFAGRGVYGNDSLGSPLRVLALLQRHERLAGATMSLVEQNLDHFANLESEIKQRHASNTAITINLKQGRFDEHVDGFLADPIYRRGKVATFSFVDPCGIKGLRMCDLGRLADQPYGEILLFFNYDGVNRLIGGIQKGTHPPNVMVDLLGSTARVEEVMQSVCSAEGPMEHEDIIRNAFIDAIRADCRCPYIVPFRFGAPTRNRTSHFLVHFCRHPLGFTVMKDVMWQIGKRDDEHGSFGFERDDVLFHPEFRWDIVDQKRKIIEALSGKPMQVQNIRIAWPKKPDDQYCTSAYRQMLLELEHEGRLLVFDKMNEYRAPASKRRKGKDGKPTLGDEYWLREAAGNG